MKHDHLWVRDVIGKYRCACGVIGYTAQNLPGQYRTASKYVKPYLCMHELDGRKHCGDEAVHVTGSRTQSRCAVHAPKQLERTGT